MIDKNFSITLGEYKGIKRAPITADVTNDEVQAAIKQEQEQRAKMHDVERPAQLGDTAVIDFAGFLGDEQFEGGTSENYSLALGSNTFIPGFEEQLVGTSAGDEVDVNVTFPENYPAGNLAGQPVVFKCKVHKVQERKLPELNDLCIPETLALCSIDSTDLGPEHWLMMAKAVQENYALYDGFIICHGTDTLAYSAAALSYLIQNADKPIILTGAQQPISNEITDAKKNLRDSVICALDPGSRGVMVVFGGHVIAGTRAKKNKTISYDAFASVNFPELALVQGDRLVRYIPSPWPTGPVEFSRTLDSRVFLLKLTPGMSPALIPEIFRLYDCVIVESFGVGGIPQQLMDAFSAGLGDYETTHKVLIMTTQVTYEGSDVGVYEVGKRVRNRFRFLEAHDMTIEAVVTKSMWLLAQNCESFDQLQQRFYRQVNFDTFYH